MSPRLAVSDLRCLYYQHDPHSDVRIVCPSARLQSPPSKHVRQFTNLYSQITNYASSNVFYRDQLSL
jgi:hypothetical protein